MTLFTHLLINLFVYVPEWVYTHTSTKVPVEGRACRIPKYLNLNAMSRSGILKLKSTSRTINHWGMPAVLFFKELLYFQLLINKSMHAHFFQWALLILYLNYLHKYKFKCIWFWQRKSMTIPLFSQCLSTHMAEPRRLFSSKINLWGSLSHLSFFSFHFYLKNSKSCVVV